MSINKYSSPISAARYCAAMALQAQPWCDPGNMAALLTTLRNTNFTTVAARVQALQAITGLATVQPYAIRNSPSVGDIRFGDSVPSPVATTNPNPNQLIPFFALWEPAVSESLQQIRSALQYKDPANDTPPDSGVQTPMDSMTLYRVYQNASQSFRWGVQNLTDDLATGKYIYDGLSFEAKYQLVWSTTAQPMPTAAEQVVTEPEAPSSSKTTVGSIYSPDKFPLVTTPKTPVFSPAPRIITDEFLVVLRKMPIRPISLYYIVSHMHVHVRDSVTAELAVEAYLDELSRRPDLPAREFFSGDVFTFDDVSVEKNLG